VLDALNNLNPNKARGTDNIAPVLLKNCACFTYPTFSQQAYSVKTNPPNGKHKIIPAYKSGDKTSVTNYHPISLLCVISKVLEHLVYDKVIDTKLHLSLLINLVSKDIHFNITTTFYLLL